MVVQELIEQARDAVTAKRVYGDPYEHEGVTLIPAATVRGGGGGGGGESEEGKGSGSGFGLMARPVGAWGIKDGDVRWKPAIDVGRMILGWQLVALAVIYARAKFLGPRKRARLKYAPVAWRKSKSRAPVPFSR